jgi:hypothetical protein
MASPDGLPGVYYRADRGWTPQVRGLVGAHLHGDQRMAAMIVNSMTVDDLSNTVLLLSGLAASLLMLCPWGDGCVDGDDVIQRWNRATAQLVAELSGYTSEAGDGDDGGDG